MSTDDPRIWVRVLRPMAIARVIPVVAPAAIVEAFLVDSLAAVFSVVSVSERLLGKRGVNSYSFLHPCYRLEYARGRVVNVAKIARNIKVIAVTRLDSPAEQCGI